MKGVDSGLKKNEDLSQKKTIDESAEAISILCAELIEQIFSFLPLQTLVVCNQVCEYWDFIANENTLWKNLLLSKFPEKREFTKKTYFPEQGSLMFWKKIYRVLQSSDSSIYSFLSKLEDMTFLPNIQLIQRCRNDRYRAELYQQENGDRYIVFQYSASKEFHELKFEFNAIYAIAISGDQLFAIVKSGATPAPNKVMGEIKKWNIKDLRDSTLVTKTYMINLDQEICIKKFIVEDDLATIHSNDGVQYISCDDKPMITFNEFFLPVEINAFTQEISFFKTELAACNADNFHVKEGMFFFVNNNPPRITLKTDIRLTTACWHFVEILPMFGLPWVASHIESKPRIIIGVTCLFDLEIIEYTQKRYSLVSSKVIPFKDKFLKDHNLRDIETNPILSMVFANNKLFCLVKLPDSSNQLFIYIIDRETEAISFIEESVLTEDNEISSTVITQFLDLL